MSHPLQVLVTGATGRTGSLVVHKLQSLSNSFSVRGFARTPQKAIDLFNSTENFFFGNILEPESLVPALDGCDALVILTSATPQIVPSAQPGQRPEFTFPSGEMPEQIDYQGQINQINVAKQAGVQQIVLVGSMGGTDEKHFLNTMGNGNILIWKRKAEQYLIDSGIDYTIIRAGGLLDQPGGKRELVVSRDDVLLINAPENVTTSIPRADVTEVVVQALLEPMARNKAFDVVSRPEQADKSAVNNDFNALFAATKPGL